MSAPVKKQKKAEEGSPLWMATFSDLMSLLLTFFILIVSFSTTEIIKFRKFMGAMRGATGSILEQQGARIIPSKFSPDHGVTMEMDVLVDLVNKMMQDLPHEMGEFENFESEVSIDATNEGIRFRISSLVLFEPGQAVLKPNGYKLLSHIARIVKKVNCYVRIEGHTDNMPIHTAQYPSNWDLSTDRSLNVLKYFANSCYLNPYKLIAVGRGEYDPIAPNDTPENRKKNRRVDIHLKWYDETGKQLLEERNGTY